MSHSSDRATACATITREKAVLIILIPWGGLPFTGRGTRLPSPDMYVYVHYYLHTLNLCTRLALNILRFMEHFGDLYISLDITWIINVELKTVRACRIQVYTYNYS